MQKKLLAGLGAVALSITMAVGAAAPAQAAPASPASAKQVADTSPVQITAAEVTDEAGAVVGTFTGTFTPTGFTTQDGALTVVGDVTGEVRDAAGTLLETVDLQGVTTNVVGGAASTACDILNLDLGPLNLDVLGLVVDLSDVQLDITAERGAGNLLGNLLCAVAGLLDGNSTGFLSNLLNRLLGL